MSNKKIDLFNNPMVEAARQALSKEDLDRYKQLGESLWKDIDFEKCAPNQLPPFMQEGALRVEEQLKSGIHPSMLEFSEVKLMEEKWGSEWYKKWGYVEEDLKEIKTVKFD